MENTLATSSGSVSPETKDKSTLTEAKCPVAHGARQTRTNVDWWPNQVNVNILHQHSPKSDPMGKEFNYAAEFKTLDLNSVIKDLNVLMTDSQSCGRLTLATMGRCSFVWRGTARVPTASATAAAGPDPVSSASRLSIAGPTT